MAVASGRADKFVGLHFFNPVQVMKLVEVIKTTHTDPETVKAVSEFGSKIGKSVVHCGDTPGFIVNRLLVPFLCQVCYKNDAYCAKLCCDLKFLFLYPPYTYFLTLSYSFYSFFFTFWLSGDADD